MRNKNCRKRGQTLVEYALILAFVSVVAVAIMNSLTKATRSDYNTINSSLGTAQNGGPAGR